MRCQIAFRCKSTVLQWSVLHLTPLLRRKTVPQMVAHYYSWLGEIHMLF